MKIWIEWNNQFFDDPYIFLGIGGYRHHEDHNWKGITIQIYLPFSKMFQINWVSDWNAYDLRINGRRKKKKFDAT